MEEKYIEEQKKASNKPLVFIFSPNPQDATWGMKDNKHISVWLEAKRKSLENTLRSQGSRYFYYLTIYIYKAVIHREKWLEAGRLVWRLMLQYMAWDN